MIATERQLQRAHDSLTQLKEALQAEQSEPRHVVGPEFARAALAGIQAQVEELETSISQFEALREGKLQSITFANLLEIPNVLISARLAAGLNQRELAEHLAVSPQQVQKDEAGDYERASIERVHVIAALLGVRISGDAQLPARGSIKPIPSREALMGLQSAGATAQAR